MDIAGMMSGTVGDLSGWAGGNAQASMPVTNLGQHVDGGGHSAGYAAPAGVGGHGTKNFAAGIVIAALIGLWLMGALVLRTSAL